MTIVIQRNYVNCKIDGVISQDVIQQLRNEMRYPAPGYRFSYGFKKGWGDGYVYLITPKRLLFPSGLLSIVENIFKQNSVEYSVLDLRTEPIPSNPIPLANRSLRDYQQDAEQKCLEHKCGVLKMPTGSGKTLIFTSLLGKLNGLKRAIYVRKLDLMEQTIRCLSEDLDLPKEDIGRIGGGVIHIKDLSVIMIPTAARALDEKYIKYKEHDDDDDDDDTPLDVNQKLAVKNFIETTDCYIVDECHALSSETAQMVSNHSKKAYYKFGFCLTGDTKIATEKGIMAIGELYDTNYRGKIWSLNEENKKIKLQNIDQITKRIPTELIYEITTASGTVLRATSNHPILTNTGYVLMEDIKDGDWVTQSGPIPQGSRFDINDFEHTCCFKTFSTKMQQQKRVYDDFSKLKRKGVIYRETRRQLIEKYGKVGNFSAWWAGKEISHIHRFLKNIGKYSLTDCDLGLLLGMMLGDGHLRKDGRGYSLFYTSNREEIKVVAQYLSSLSIPFSKYKHHDNKTPEGQESNCEQIKISGVLPRMFVELDFPVGNKTKTAYKIPQIVMTGKNDIKCGFLQGLFFSDGTIYHRKMYNSCEIKLSQVKENVLDENLIRLLQDMQMLLLGFGIKTSLFEEKYDKKKRGIYILAESKIDFIREIGFWQGPKYEHSCAIYKTLQDRKIHSNLKGLYELIVQKKTCNQEPVYDLINVSATHNFVANGIVVHNSATPWRTDGTDILINASTGPRIVDITASSLIERGFLVPPRVHFFKMKRDWNQHVSSNYQEVYTQFIVKNEERNKRIVDITKRLASKGERTVILVQRKEHGQILEQMLNDEGLIAKFIFGESCMTDREFAIEQFKSGSLDVLLGSSILNEGIDIKCITALVNAAGGKSSSSYYQKIGRAIRVDDKNALKTRAIVIDFIDAVKYLDKHSKERIKVLQIEPLYEVKIQD